MASTIIRIYTAFSPPVVEKRSDAIRIGILGAAKIAYESQVTIKRLINQVQTPSPNHPCAIPPRSHCASHLS